jgi:biopolymer transport protein ExbD
MAMSSGGTGSAVSGINVTPLIDVLLVLLIIFMVIVPVTPSGLDALIPQPPQQAQTRASDLTAIVVQVSTNAAGAPSYKINEEPISANQLRSRLSALYATRQEKVMFVKGDAGLEYSQIANVIDLGKAAGVDNIGVITPRSGGGR